MMKYHFGTIFAGAIVGKERHSQGRSCVVAGGSTWLPVACRLVALSDAGLGASEESGRGMPGQTNEEVIVWKKLSPTLLVLLIVPPAPVLGQAGMLAEVDEAQIAALFALKSGISDTCSATWDAPFYYLWDFIQHKCEATRCDLGESQLISAVHVTWFNYGEVSSEKPVEILIWADAAGLPGELLWSLETTTTMLDGNETRLVQYDVVPPLEAQTVWFGHRELVTGPPSSLFDGVPDGIHASAEPPCGAFWTLQDLGDYLQMLEFGAGPTAVSGEPLPEGPALSFEQVVRAAPGEYLITFHVGPQMPVTLRVFSSTGRLVDDITPEGLGGPGRYTVTWDGRTVSSGVYFLALGSPTSQQARKIVMVR